MLKEILGTEASVTAEPSEQGTQRDQKSFLAARNSFYKKPMTPGASTKPKNIFSGHIAANSSKYFFELLSGKTNLNENSNNIKRPHRPQDENHAKHAIPRGVAERVYASDVDAQGVNIKTEQSEGYERLHSAHHNHYHESGKKLGGQKDLIQPSEADDEAEGYHCGELENDEDSIILTYANQNPSGKFI